jgi:hypothetical protein
MGDQGQQLNTNRRGRSHFFKKVLIKVYVADCLLEEQILFEGAT